MNTAILWIKTIWSQTAASNWLFNLILIYLLSIILFIYKYAYNFINLDFSLF